MEGRDDRQQAPSMQSGPPPSFSAYYHHRPPPSPPFNAPPTPASMAAAMRHTMAVAAHSHSPAVQSFSPDPSASSALNPTIPPPPGINLMAAMNMAMPSPARLEPVKRKRGRPRKYETDANGVGGMALALSTTSSLGSHPPEKRGRGSGKKAQLAALGAAGQGFTPHVIRVAAGEDVAMRIMSFLQQGPFAVCVLSANGAISNATLRQSIISGGTVTYEGRYEILSLTGSFFVTENGNACNRTGGLSISLAGSDGRVVGGGVAGLLVAASPVLVVLGTFFPDVGKNQVQPGIHESEPGMTLTGTIGALPPSLQMGSLTHEDTPGSMQDHFSGGADVENQQQQRMSHVIPFHTMDWTGTHFDAEARDDTNTVPSPQGGS